MDTINLTPSEEGYASIAQMFVEQIMADVRKARKDASANLMVSVIQTAAYLGQQGRQDLVKRIMDGTR